MKGSDHVAGKMRDRGTDNVLSDLEFQDAEELTAKAILAKKINDIVERRGLTQSAAAKLLGMPQPKISAIRNYKLRGISLERLMQALTALGQHVEIVVSPCNQDTPARIVVAA
jgi:predicted XRE-type DNA-binding protein